MKHLCVSTKLTLLLSYLVFLPQGVASPSIETPESSTINDSSPQLFAASEKPKKRRAKKKSKDKTEATNDPLAAETNVDGKKTKLAGPTFGARGHVGIAVGGDSESTPIYFGGDGVYFLMPMLSFQAGVLFTSISEETDQTALNATILSLDVAGYYHFRVIPMLSLDGGFRLGQTTLSTSIDTELTEPVNDSLSFITGTVAFGATTYFGIFTAGAEVRKVVYAGDDTFESTGFVVLGSVGVAF